ncbi:uridine kinase [bacterium]|nr:uridine kinase [bacterium]
MSDQVRQRAVVVGVSGGSGSGKTTFCREFVSQLGEDNVLHLKQDNYYRDLSDLTPEQRVAVNFDHPQALEFELLSAHLKTLLRGEAVEIPLYDFASHTRKKSSLRAAPRPVIVIEGILIFSQQSIVDQLDHSIFVDAPENIRLTRRIERDIAERGRTREHVQTQFFETVAPMHNLFVEPSKLISHRVISGEEPFAEEIARLTSLLKLPST